MDSDKRCSIIVSSCDAYSDLWNPFFNSFFRHWGDCSFPIYLLTESKECEIEHIKTIKAGIDTNWSDRLKFALSYVKTDRIILILEDFLLRSKVDNHEVESCLSIAFKENINMLRLIPRPSPDKKDNEYENLGLISPGSKFRVSTQSAIWDTQVLNELLVPNESIWEFEHNGSKRSNSITKFYSVINPVLTYKHHVVERGKWFPWSSRYFLKQDIGIDLGAREVMNFFETSRWILQKSIGPLANRLPKAIRSLLKPFLLRIKIID